MPDADPNRLVQCVKLDKELPGLAATPMPNELGQYIFENLSKEGWDLWLSESVKFINTYSWDLSSKEGTEKLLAQLRIWLGLEEGEALNTAWTPPKEGPNEGPKEGEEEASDAPAAEEAPSREAAASDETKRDDE